LIDVIIFSKDRACQLDALLRSMDKNFHIPHSRIVITKTSTPEFNRGYCQLDTERKCRWVLEQNFKVDLDGVLDTTTFPFVLFLVDDDIIVQPIEVDEVFNQFRRDKNILTLSWRLGGNITRSQILGKDVKLPVFNGPVWNWKGSDVGWDYPMALDGHLYRREDIVPLIKSLSYDFPNRLEAIMATQPLPQPLMICPPISKVVGFCLNRVQDVYQNRCGNVSADFLNKKWLGGQRIALGPILGGIFDSVHVEGPVTFEERR